MVPWYRCPPLGSGCVCAGRLLRVRRHLVAVTAGVLGCTLIGVDGGTFGANSSGVATPKACLEYNELFPQIWDDFAAVAQMGPIHAENVSSLMQRVKEHNGWQYYFVEIAIVNGKLYTKEKRSTMGIWQLATLRLIQQALTSYASSIPDVYFVLSVLDEPFLERERDKPLPLLAALTTRLHWDIPVPANAYFDDGGISSGGLGKSDFASWESEAFQASLERLYSWERRSQKAFFRGHDWDSINTFIESLPTAPREPCVDKWSVTSSFGYRRWYEELSAPGAALHKLLDVGLTGCPDFALPKRKGRGFAEPVDLPDHAQHKYLLHLDGTAHSTRLLKLLTVGSVVIKQDSIYEEWFYRNLRPYEHFVPFSRDRCDHGNLSKTVEWLRSNDDFAKRIARQGQALQRRLLSTAGAACYWQRLLAVYGALQAFDPRSVIRISDFELWPSPAGGGRKGANRAEL
eukprot:TRINITY_DN24277_c0_g3_i1.p1 TRINITY_DN24277_c0_g3~~TRINITY_DN24277_c0_g3_i1.p1  ORF type:complete len:459 (+),score=54.80 TRINITY_DN24277_c0_g3_i1:18-1394(+)